ncbi:MAG: hypothetical protein C4K60_07170 [Ideonella sp. MAG2]|nr:MAG: hypothetical protein C4K60_07170 [Ideonella sp. MAG2]
MAANASSPARAPRCEWVVCLALALLWVLLPVSVRCQPISRVLAIEDEARSRPDLARDKLLMMRAGMAWDDPEQIDLLRVLGEVSFVGRRSSLALGLQQRAQRDGRRLQARRPPGQSPGHQQRGSGAGDSAW